MAQHLSSCPAKHGSRHGNVSSLPIHHRLRQHACLPSLPTRLPADASSAHPTPTARACACSACATWVLPWLLFPTAITTRQTQHFLQGHTVPGSKVLGPAGCAPSLPVRPPLMSARPPGRRSAPQAACRPAYLSAHPHRSARLPPLRMHPGRRLPRPKSPPAQPPLPCPLQASALCTTRTSAMQRMPSTPLMGEPPCWGRLGTRSYAASRAGATEQCPCRAAQPTPCCTANKSAGQPVPLRIGRAATPALAPCPCAAQARVGAHAPPPARGVCAERRQREGPGEGAQGERGAQPHAVCGGLRPALHPHARHREEV